MGTKTDQIGQDGLRGVVDPARVLVPLSLEAISMLGIRSKSHYYAQVAAGKAPQPVKVSSHGSALVLADIYAHNDRAIAERDAAVGVNHAAA